jgi:hypothetical protein
LLAYRIYKNSSRLHNEAARQGLRVYYDERLAGDVRVTLLVPVWFPTAYSPFDWSTLTGQRIPVVVALRGTVQVRVWVWGVGRSMCPLEQKRWCGGHVPYVSTVTGACCTTAIG